MNCNIYKVEIDSRGRKMSAEFKDLYNYVRMDLCEEMDYETPGQDSILYSFSKTKITCHQKISKYNLTGYVNTPREIWLHPPRGGDYFRQLQLNPYPFLKKKNKVGVGSSESILRGVILDGKNGKELSP